MADPAFYFDQLLPGEALALLADAARRPELHAELTTVRTGVHTGVFGPSATLCLPAGQDRDTPLLVHLTTAYRSLKGTEPARRAEAEAEADPLFSGLEGLARLLLFSGHEEGAAAEPAFPTEYLLVGPDLSDEAAAALFEDLRFHATQTRLATAAAEGGGRHIFHVLDDDRRRSSFGSLQAAEGLAGLVPLTGYRADGFAVFLPRTPAPSEAALRHLIRLLVQNPAFLGRTEPPLPGMLLAVDGPAYEADADADANTRVDAYFLGRLTFLDQAGLTQKAHDWASFRYHDLADSPDMVARLRAALTRAAPHVGYRLELRPMRRQDPADVARMRLLEQQSEIAYKLAYLDSVSRPRPRLIRFTERALPAMAEMLRAIPLEVLRRGYPKYGFQARKLPEGAPGHAEDGAGLHYLYLEPDQAVLEELDPLMRWGQGPDAPTRFQLDPFWARYYHGQGAASLVFVPENLALFPPMHGWTEAHMDAYLRDVVGAWFADKALPDLPASPVYLFEGAPDPEAPITLSVLDLDALVPLHTRLGWLNDHLYLAHALDTEHLIGQLAHDTGRKALADDIALQAAAAEQHLEALLVSTAELTAAKLTDMTDAVTQELNTVLARTHETADYLKDLYDYLQELTRLGRGAEHLTAQAFRGLVKTEGRYRDLTRFIQKLETDIEHELNQADMARLRVTNKVQRSIKELGSTHEALHRKLREILRMGP